MTDGLLAGLRVLDLTAPAATGLAGRLLADLGAEVVHSRLDDGSLRWQVEQAGTTGLPPAEAERLLARADVVLAHRDRLDGEVPQAVWVCVTPFGLQGPRAGWRAGDLSLVAAGGGLYPTGDPDRPPVRPSQPSAVAHAAPEIVVAALTALASGEPQRVDLSLQETMLSSQLTAPTRWPQEHNRGRRRGTFTGRTRETWRCADGYVSFGLRGGGARVQNLQTLTALAEADGVATPALRDRDWATYDPKSCTDDELRTLETAVTAFFAGHTVRELYATAVRTGLMLAPANTAADLVASAQLEARGFFAPLGEVKAVPRACLRAGPDEDLVTMRGPATRAGLAPEWDERRTAYAPWSAEGPRAWSGLRLVELGSGAAGPIATRYFADHGATVVRIESATRPDFLRVYALGPHNPHGLEGSHFFAALNGGKLDLSLNMKHPDAVALARRLVLEWADALVENFAPGATAKWGLDHASLAAARPDLVVSSGCLWGQTGPEKDYPGFGGQGAALSGWTSLTGWPDRAPVGPAGTITDSLAPRFVAAGLAAALLHRRRTGRGCSLDLSQVEAAAWSLGPWLAEESATGDAPTREGNRHPDAVPHGVFPCADEDGVSDRWLALAVWSDAEWARACQVLGVAADAAMDTVAGRQARAGDVEAVVAAATRHRGRAELAVALQAEGLDAYPVLDWGDVHDDPQLLARRHFVTHEHPVMGPQLYEENGFRLAGTPGGVAGPGPLLGEHTDRVLGDTLGVAPEEVARLHAAGALT